MAIIGPHNEKEFYPALPKGEKARQLLDRAGKHLAGLRNVEQQSAYASPEDIGPMELLRVAMTALSSALDTEDWNIAAEALSMLFDCERQAREMQKIGLAERFRQ